MSEFLTDRIVELSEELGIKHEKPNRMSGESSGNFVEVVSFHLPENGIFRRYYMERSGSKIEKPHFYPVALTIETRRDLEIIFNSYKKTMKEMGKLLRRETKGNEQYLAIRKQLTLYREKVRAFYNSLHFEGYVRKNGGGKSLILHKDV